MITKVSKERCQEWNGSSWQWLSVSKPGLRTDGTCWLQAFVPAKELETTSLAQFSLTYPASANTRRSILARSYSLPWNARVDQEWQGERRNWMEGERSCTKTGAPESCKVWETVIWSHRCCWRTVFMNWKHYQWINNSFFFLLVDL